MLVFHSIAKKVSALLSTTHTRTHNIHFCSKPDTLHDFLFQKKGFSLFTVSFSQSDYSKTEDFVISFLVEYSVRFVNVQSA